MRVFRELFLAQVATAVKIVAAGDIAGSEAVLVFLLIAGKAARDGPKPFNRLRKKAARVEAVKRDSTDVKRFHRRRRCAIRMSRLVRCSRT